MPPCRKEEPESPEWVGRLLWLCAGWMSHFQPPQSSRLFTSWNIELITGRMFGSFVCRWRRIHITQFCRWLQAHCHHLPTDAKRAVILFCRVGPIYIDPEKGLHCVQEIDLVVLDVMCQFRLSKKKQKTAGPKNYDSYCSHLSIFKGTLTSVSHY